MARFQVVVEIEKFPVGKTQGASIQVNLAGKAGLVSPLYADRSSSTTLSNPFTTNTAKVNFYLPSQEPVDIIVTPSGGVAVTLMNIPVTHTLPIHQAVKSNAGVVTAWYTY